MRRSDRSDPPPDGPAAPPARPLISNIQRFSLDDGPGIRTTVFVKGCNLRCAWCHNPECLTPGHSLQFHAAACTACGRCAAVCPRGCHRLAADGRHHLDRTDCDGCGLCARHCRAGALQVIGRYYPPPELTAFLARDRRYYAESGGGVTFSGGEPLLFPVWLRETMALCRAAGLTTAVDTAGRVPYAAFQAVAPVTDLFLFDVKLFTPARHRAATGVSGERIRANLQRLTAAGAPVWVRVPVVPGYNADLRELGRVAGFLAALPGRAAIKRVDLLPYHDYGAGKYADLGLVYGVQTPPPDGDLMREAFLLFENLGLPVKQET
ncbi:MAG: glycyl-radical enzyme activating protein [Gracilibacteraceae bacterium]|jgi:pyruvate formate lyase activating enzyme|nr:glycyl-radical enzyme activating protein [Gracilibacteraceae bacterium]